MLMQITNKTKLKTRSSIRLVLGCAVAMIVSGLPESVMAQQFRPPTNSTRGKDGAVLGGLVGAVLGGIAGHQNDETPGGIAIGAGVGALAGNLLGRSEDQLQAERYAYQQQSQQAYQQRVSRAISMQDVILLSQNGVSPTLIMNQINDNGVTHRLAVNDILHLHKNGVSEVIINAMQAAPLATSRLETARVARTPVVTQRETIYVRPAPPVTTLHFYGGSRGHHHHRSYDCPWR